MTAEELLDEWLAAYDNDLLDILEAGDLDVREVLEILWKEGHIAPPEWIRDDFEAEPSC